ncbi:MAG: winged helix-turn-helix domain-containing protein [Clostridiales bacterium]|nr:winged helix-turn-helix domain-containing protein [Clostridiales bacterium]
MTIRRRLARSNLVMILIPVAIAAVLLLLGGGLALLLLERVWLPRLGLSFAALHETGEQLETAFAGAKALAAIYAGTVILALLATVAFTNFYLTRSLFRHISAPLQTLVAGVERIRGGNLESPIGYTAEDEFKPACDAVDAMAARLKASLDAQSRQQQRQELIAGMSHDLKSPLTSIRAYTEGLLDGVAKDEAARTRYLQTIYAKESELEALVNRLFSFAKLDLDEAPADLVPLDIAGTLQSIVDSCDAEALDVRLGELPEGRVLADRELLTRSIANLLDNSRKYGAGHAIVSAEVTAKDVCISATDNGPGVDPAQLEKIFKNGVELPLKNREYELLLFLMRHPGQVFSREDLYEMIWGLESMGDNITVAVHIGRIREKLEDDPASPKLLQTVWGVGYRLRTDAV